MSEEDAILREMFQLLQGTDMGDMDLKDFEDVLKSRMGMSNVGAVDPSLYEDVQTGTEDVELPYRDLYDQYTSYAPTIDPETGEPSDAPLEAEIARKVYDENLSPEQVVAEFRREYARQNSTGDNRLSSNGRHDDRGLQSQFESQVDRVRKTAEDLAAERRSYESAKAGLAPEARAYMEANPGARTFSTPIMERSKAAQAYDDYGLPTPADQWKNDDFFQGFSQRKADTDAKRDFLSQVQPQVREATRQRRSLGGSDVGQQRWSPGGNNLGQDLGRAQVAEARRWGAQAGSAPSPMNEEFKALFQEATGASNRGRFEGHLADQRRQILAAAGRTPLTEAMRARMGL